MIPYFPAEGGKYRLSLGLKVLPPEDWIEFDTRYESDLAEKKRLLGVDTDPVFLALPGSETAQQRLVEYLNGHLATVHPDRFTAVEGGLRNRTTREVVVSDPDAPLKSVAGLVQEDILLLQPSPEGHRLVAGLLCFPTRWKLSDKIGKPLAAIHDPVPGYEAKLSRPMDRLFAGLTPERLLWRENFSLLDDPALFQPGGHFKIGAGLDLTAETIGDELWFRVERQTIRVLPETDVAVFTVPIHQARLRDVVHSPGRAADLLAVSDTMPEPMKNYKSMPGFEAPLRAWLEARLT